MINLQEKPEEWATLMYELEDAKEHLRDLIDKMNSQGNIDEVDYEINLGHIFAHLNRAWNSRNIIGEYDDKKRSKISAFPKDIEPCG